MLKKILIGLAVVIVGFLVVVALQPSQYRVARTAHIAAPPEALFPYVNDLHKFQVWNPWAKIDPAAKQTFDGPEAGIGAVSAWESKEIGDGRMTIVESRPNELVRYKMEFLKPFASTASADITLKVEGNQTIVTWGMSGENNFLCKAMGLLMSMDKMVGDEFAKGLASLKKITEGAQSAPK